MDTERLPSRAFERAPRPVLAGLLVGMFVLVSALAAAQEPAPAAKPSEEPDFFTSIGRWFDRQAENINSSFKDAGKQVENFGREAGVAAKSTAATAKEAADAVARIPNARVVRGHEKCRIAPNGAPDCIAAANAVCKTKGFGSGKSVDMTTAENCPARVWISGRKTAADCTTETFVSRALCQ